MKTGRTTEDLTVGAPELDWHRAVNSLFTSQSTPAYTGDIQGGHGAIISPLGSTLLNN